LPTIKKKLLISIQDTGIGIKKIDLSKLFKYFGKLNDNQKINTKGTGLGLMISRKIV
jgi:signal transduction histidine kinase